MNGAEATDDGTRHSRETHIRHSGERARPSPESIFKIASRTTAWA